METNKLLNAEEFFEEQIGGLYFSNTMGKLDIYEVMKDFAKLHVEAALKAASEKAEITYLNKYNLEIDKESILNSYPLDNIK